MNVGLYIHIPFCLQKCSYCDFPSYTGFAHIYPLYTAALCREISGWGGVLAGDIIDTIYIGGGTPTLLPVKELTQIMNCVRDNFLLSASAEFSIEANPGTVDEEKLHRIRAGGLNRISFGIQTFSAKLLQCIGRVHSATQAVEAVTTAKKVGFANINIDLMYGLPQQKLEDLKDSMTLACDLGVAHLSMYGLKIEEGTPFYSWYKQGQLTLPREEEEERMYDLVNEYLPSQGYDKYEISNFAKPGKICRHNMKYWNYQPYIGVGAAAHSFFNGERTANAADVMQYMQAINAGGSAVQTRENLDEQTAMSEFIFLALRTAQGMNIMAFNCYFHTDFMAHYGEIVQSMEEKGLLERGDGVIRLTPFGMKFGNVVFAAFLRD